MNLQQIFSQLAKRIFASNNEALSLSDQAETRNVTDDLLILELRRAASQFVGRF